MTNGNGSLLCGCTVNYQAMVNGVGGVEVSFVIPDTTHAGIDMHTVSP